MLASNPHMVTLSDVRIQSRNGTEILQGVNLELKQREIACLIGASGSGKSMTCLGILDLLPPGIIKTEGTIQFHEGKSVKGRDVAMIFQNPSSAFNPLFSITTHFRETLKKLGLGHDEIRSRMNAALLEVGFSDPDSVRKLRPYQMSGGMLQRCMIAIAVASRVKLLLADEPTTALDKDVQSEILSLLLRIREKYGTSIILVTHDLEVAMAVADSIHVMERGKIVESGTAKELLDSPSHPATQILVKAHHVLIHRSLALKRSDEKPLFSVKDISKRYRIRGFFKKQYFTALKDVKLIVQPGRTLGVVGPTGSGKSTLGRILLGLEEASSGEVLYGEKVVRKRYFRHHKDAVQVVFQDVHAAINPRYSLRETIMEPLMAKGPLPENKREERIKEVVSQVGLSHIALDRLPHTLSGGELQRLAIARAIVCSPKCIVLDEALSSLDMVVQAQIVTLLEKLQKELGIAYVLISHNLHLVRAMSHEIVQLKQGRIIARNHECLETISH